MLTDAELQAIADQYLHRELRWQADVRAVPRVDLDEPAGIWFLPEYRSDVSPEEMAPVSVGLAFGFFIARDTGEVIRIVSSDCPRSVAVDELTSYALGSVAMEVQWGPAEYPTPPETLVREALRNRLTGARFSHGRRVWWFIERHPALIIVFVAVVVLWVAIWLLRFLWG